jgi:hypothetical protein
MTDAETGSAQRAAPRSVEEALARAGDHARNALAEAVRAVRCLLDAGSLAATGVPAEGHEAVRRAAGWLDEAAALAASGPGREATRWLAGVSDALDAEIERWETRSHSDPEARAVLRAFLGVRELLWEFGLRPPAAGGASPQAGARGPAPPPRRAGAVRLERVPVEG